MPWHVIGPLNPLDRYDDCSVPFGDFVAQRQKDAVSLTDLLDAIRAYTEAAGSKQPQWRHEPRVWFDPFSDDFAILVKEENNGTMYLVVRDPAPYQRLVQE